ncbi:class I SAM-dependent methyltransferase [Flavobacterium anhuiense]|uniref:class I SAM-dependent methyltransferase n=1 Tax=Flavobacterium anhuiense TaxID=459526 RepID=UPI003D99C209
MDENLQNFWKLYYERFSNDRMIRSKHNPLREYEDEFVDGPVLELGCGQSCFLVELSKSGKEIYAVDNESSQLNFLHKRITEYGPADQDKIHLLNLTVLRDQLPERVFSIVIMSDIMHFFGLEDAKTLMEQIISRTAQGSLVYLRVHSKKHSYNDSLDPSIHDYFKHFFSVEDLDKLFDEAYFECLVCSETRQFTKSKHELDLELEWLSSMMDEQGITDPEERDQAIRENSSDIVDAWISCIYRRK